MLKNNKVLDETEEQEEDNGSSYDEAPVSRSFLYSHMFSLRTILVINVVAVSVICVLSTGLIGFGFFYSNIVKSALTSRKLNFEAVCINTANTLSTIRSVGTTWQSSFPRLDLEDPLVIMNMTMDLYPRILELTPVVTTAYCGNRLGESGGVLTKTPDQQNINLISSYGDMHTFLVTPLDLKTKTLNYSLTEVWSDIPDEFIFGTYYAAANTTKTMKWTLSYFNVAFPGFIWVTLAFPKLDKDGYMETWCALDMTCASTSYYLQRQMKFRDTSVAVVIERQTGHLLACSDETIPLNNDTHHFTGLEPSNKNRKVRDTILFMESRYKNPNTGLLEFDFEGDEDIQYLYTEYSKKGHRQMVNIAFIQDEFGIEWVVVQNIDSITFFKEFRNSILIMLGVLVVLLALLCLAGLVAGTFIMRPLQKLVVQAGYIEELNLEFAEVSLLRMSVLSEISSLQAAFLSLCRRIKQLRAFIPDHILAVIESDSADEIENVQLPSAEEPSQKASDTETSDKASASSESTWKHPGNRGISFELGIREKNVTLVRIELTQSIEQLAEFSPQQITEASKHLISIAHKIVRETRGQVVQCSFNSILTVWNAQIPVSEHVQRALTFSKRLTDSIHAFNQNNQHEEHFIAIRPCISIATGTSLIGNLGTDATKVFSVVGNTFCRTMLQVQLASEYGVQCVIGQEIATIAANHFQTRPFTSYQFEQSNITLYELGPLKKKDADEWMYELQNIEHNGAWELFAEAYREFESGEYASALEKFTSFHESNPSDPLTLKLINQIKERQASEEELF